MNNFDKSVIESHLIEYRELLRQLNDLRIKYVFLLDIKRKDEYYSTLEEFDKEISLLKEQSFELEADTIDLNEVPEDKIIKLKEMKEKYEDLIEKSEVIYKALEIYERIEELENIIVKSVHQLSVNKKNKDIHSLFYEATDNKELEAFIDAVCISFYKVPLLIALITKDPSDIIRDFSITELSEEIRNNIIDIIERKKLKIESNLILSDKALINLIEQSTGYNIANQQRHNERIPTNFNNQFNGQVLIEKGNDYTLLNNQRSWDRSTSGTRIKRFDELNSEEQFSRRDSDMLVRNFPILSSEDLVYRSFKGLPNDKKKNMITAILYNLELCYEMFKSYYMSDKMEVPVLLKLTNGESVSFSYNFSNKNIPHILGIPPTHEFDRKEKRFTDVLKLPQETIDFLGLDRANALEVLERIIERKADIIENCGLLKIDGAFYEMLPWEKIILKTNAFIRGDFFKTTSLITPINPNSFLISDRDNITCMSITETKFGLSAINQALLDPNISFDEAITIIRSNSQNSDFIFKGMTYDNYRGFWIPKTNLSAIGERIKPYNAKTLKTLEKYRYLLSGNIDPDNGGFIASVESLKSFDLYREYSVQEMLASLIGIADSFATTKEIEDNLRSYLEQIEQINSNHKTR